MQKAPESLLLKTIKMKQIKKHLIYITLMLVSLAFIPTLSAQSELFDDLTGNIDIVVAGDGSGDFTTVSQALNNVPNNSSERTVIFIRNGRYKEKIDIPSTKKNLVLIGEDVDSTILTYDDYADLVGGTFNTASFKVNASDFLAMNITFDNSAGDVGQALALFTNGDRQIFYHCRMIGWQDTYYTDHNIRNYIKDCFIEGAVDYIFGFAVAYFDSCQIHSVRQSGGYITAASTPDGYDFGYVFNHCNITGAPGVRNFTLGRPWRPTARTVFMNCYENDLISAPGWNSWSRPATELATVFYAEYNNNGPGYQPNDRVDWSYILTNEQAAEYTMENIFSSNTASDFSSDWMPEIENDALIGILDNHIVPFMDSINYNANISKINYNGTTFDLSPGLYDYFIELDPETTEVPVFDVFTDNPRATVEIVYPESLPGLTTILVTAYDRSTYREVKVYNSVNDAYNNAYLDSLFLKNIKVENFDPEVFEYDFVLPKGSSKYFAIKPFKHVDDATYRINKPSSLPGLLTITVTSYSGLVVNEYKINVSVSTGLENIQTENILKAYYTNGGLVIESKTGSNSHKSFNLDIYDVNGKKVNTVFIKSLTEERKILPMHLNPGIYFYKAQNESFNTSGNFRAK